MDQLEKKGFYENACGDLMLPALAHSLCVDIFVINISRGAAPFYPVPSTVWGGNQTNKPPLLLVYDGVHYEPLLPATAHDSQLTIELMQNCKAGKFYVTDISKVGLDERRQGSHSTEQQKKNFEQLAKSDRVERAGSTGALQVNNGQEWTRVEKGGKKKKEKLKETKKPKFTQTKQKKTVFGDIEVCWVDAKVPNGLEPHPKVYSCKSVTTSPDPMRTKTAEKRKEIARRKAAARKMRRRKQAAKEKNLIMADTPSTEEISITLPSPPKHEIGRASCRERV